MRCPTATRYTTSVNSITNDAELADSLTKIADAREIVADACRRIAEELPGSPGSIAESLALAYDSVANATRDGALWTQALYDLPETTDTTEALHAAAGALLAEAGLMQTERVAMMLMTNVDDRALDVAEMASTFTWALAHSLARTAHQRAHGG